MSSDNDQFNSLVRFLLPEELFDYFEIVHVMQDGVAINIHLDEINTPPEGYKKEDLITKGFHNSASVQDFPIREKPCYLHIRRRRWQVKTSGKIISRDWKLLAEGTRYTQSFATFLKGAFGLSSH